MSTEEVRADVLRAVRALGDGSFADSRDLCKSLSVSHETLLDGSLKALSASERIRLEPVTHARWLVSEEGHRYADNGTPEYAVFTTLRSSGKPTSAEELCNLIGDDATASRGRQQALKKKWVVFDGKSKTLSVKDGINPVDEIAEALKKLVVSEGNPDVLSGDMLKQLKSRKLATSKPYLTYKVYKGEKINIDDTKQATELTKAMLDTGSWKDMQFKPYNFDADGKPPEGGCLHTLLKVREQFRLIFLEMGFEEMPTNNYIESSFWNFDALFQPQQHPARDEHDTFFISNPPSAKIPDEAYMHRVREVHEKGGYGSRGYRYNWSEEEARKNILRTHTTAVSSRMLYLLAQEGEFRPRKYFSIDRVFRNETLDATHLAEFHQIEGLVADRNLSLGHLKGIIHEFFKKMGMAKLRFKPTHNPYTTPSLEIHSYHEGLGKWVEVGNSGVFRPEMVRPMGIPEDVTVIAWGLSLERPTMIRYGISNIRDLFGHRVDLSAIQSNPLCRLTF